MVEVTAKSARLLGPGYKPQGPTPGDPEIVQAKFAIAQCVQSWRAGRDQRTQKKPRHRLSTGFAFIAAVLAMIGMSSPVLAAYYDSPGFTGGASNGYNAYQQRDQ